MKERIKKIRKELDLTQQEFSDRLGIKRGTIANYELGRNAPIDAVISLICREFDVNEEWLRTGEGEMFRPKPSDILEQLAREYQFSDADYALVEKYTSIPPAKRKELIENVFHLLHELESALSDADPHATAGVDASPAEPAAKEHPAASISIQDAEAEYIKSRSRNAQKKDLSVSNTTAGNAVND